MVSIIQWHVPTQGVASAERSSHSSLHMVCVVSMLFWFCMTKSLVAAAFAVVNLFALHLLYGGGCARVRVHVLTLKCGTARARSHVCGAAALALRKVGWSLHTIALTDCLALKGCIRKIGKGHN